MRAGHRIVVNRQLLSAVMGCDPAGPIHNIRVVFGPSLTRSPFSSRFRHQKPPNTVDSISCRCGFDRFTVNDGQFEHGWGRRRCAIIGWGGTDGCRHLDREDQVNTIAIIHKGGSGKGYGSMLLLFGCFPRASDYQPCFSSLSCLCMRDWPWSLERGA